MIKTEIICDHCGRKIKQCDVVEMKGRYFRPKPITTVQGFSDVTDGDEHDYSFTETKHFCDKICCRGYYLK